MWPPSLYGSVCGYHRAALGSYPKHIIYTLLFPFKFELYCEKNENKQRRGRDWPIPIKRGITHHRRVGGGKDVSLDAARAARSSISGDKNTDDDDDGSEVKK